MWVVLPLKFQVKMDFQEMIVWEMFSINMEIMIPIFMMFQKMLMLQVLNIQMNRTTNIKRPCISIHLLMLIKSLFQSELV